MDKGNNAEIHADSFLYMNKEEKVIILYTSPEIEVLMVRVENGFSASGNGDGNGGGIGLPSWDII